MKKLTQLSRQNLITLPEPHFLKGNCVWPNNTKKESARRDQVPTGPAFVKSKEISLVDPYCPGKFDPYYRNTRRVVNIRIPYNRTTAYHLY